jgi:hypothetical protein
MDKQIVIKIGIDTKKDEFATIINTKGFSEVKEVQNISEIIGWLEVLKQQELDKISKLVSSD